MTGDFRSDNKIFDAEKRSHRIRDRHFAVDILASAAGGALVSAIVQKSWLCGLLTVVLAAGVYVFDRIGIENEEKIEKD
jgi:hypothetical protein